MTLRAAAVLGSIGLYVIPSCLPAAEQNPGAAKPEVGYRSERLPWIERVRALKSLMPNDLESLGVTVTVLPESREYTMRRWYRYKLENGFDLSFGFDDACASEMRISQPMSPDWIPQAAELENNSG